MLRSLSEGSLDNREEEVSYECLVSCSSSASSEPRTEEEMEGARGELTPAQMDHLMSVIAGMDSVKGAGGGGSPPPTDDEIRQFIDYMGHGVVNQERLDYDASRDQPEPPKRSKTAQQYFWRRHYLSIIQEDEAEEETPGSSRPSSRPCSTYENSLASRLSRLGALSPLTQGKEMDGRGSWGSEMSVDSINSILSEEGSLTSTGSFQSELVEQEVGERLAPPGLSCLLDLVQPPSCTPDSMAGPPCTPDTLDRTSSCTSPNTLQEESPTSAATVLKVIKPMGSQFKQQIKKIEDLKRQGKVVGVGQCSGSVVLPPPLPSSRLPLSPEVKPPCQHILHHLSSPCLDGDEEEQSSKGAPGTAVSGDGGGTSLPSYPVVSSKEATGEVARPSNDGGVKGGKDFLRPVVPGASPRQARKDLTISTLIAECEEYVQTDKFTRDLSEELVTLFRTEKSASQPASPPPCPSSPPASRPAHPISPPSSPLPAEPLSTGQGVGKPPRIPDTMRPRPSPKLERAEKAKEVNTPKFPVTMRGSTYDNVGESEGEDEGIENDYSDDSGSSGGVQCSQCRGGSCTQHESSPALTSEGYDSAHESGKEMPFQWPLRHSCFPHAAR